MLHHIPVYKDFQPFLVFMWDKEVYCYKMLPFGLYKALAVFTGMMVSSGKLAREMKLNVLAF